MKSLKPRPGRTGRPASGSRRSKLGRHTYKSSATATRSVSPRSNACTRCTPLVETPAGLFPALGRLPHFETLAGLLPALVVCGALGRHRDLHPHMRQPHQQQLFIWRGRQLPRQLRGCNITDTHNSSHLFFKLQSTISNTPSTS
jgi:hypothetical protein